MTRASASKLHEDQRGAIMLMGLFMSCFLIGGLWFLIGIGDAIVFRDTMQEATDHAAFTSAVLHAKGMNFISACNLILLALIAVHIIMGLIHDILLSICIAGAVFSAGTACVPWTLWRPIYTGYGKSFKQVARVFHHLEQAAAVGYPFVGVAKAYTVGSDYGEFGPKKQKRDINVLAITTSLVPGNALNGVVSKVFAQEPASGTSAGKKSFLPVEPKPYDNVCKHMASAVLNSIAQLTGLSVTGPAMELFKGILKPGIVLRYCNSLGASAAQASQVGDRIDQGNKKIKEDNKIIDARNGKDGSPSPEKGVDPVKTGGIGGALDPGLDPWWGEDGPFLPWAGTSNGSAWQQIWAINLLPDFKDVHQHRVHIAANSKHVEQDAKVWAYLAQAEFFFDCTKSWHDSQCNGEDNAGYSIKWRARLRRLQLAQMGSLLSGFEGTFMKQLTVYDAFKKKFGTSGIADRFGKTIGGALGVSSISDALDGIFKGIEGQTGQKVLGPGGELLDKNVNGVPGKLGAYH